MRDVRAVQKIVVRADDRSTAVIGGGMDGDTFAKGIAVANLNERDPALPFQILRPQTDAGEGKNLILPAQRRVSVNYRVGMQTYSRRPARPARRWCNTDR